MTKLRTFLYTIIAIAILLLLFQFYMPMQAYTFVMKKFISLSYEVPAYDNLICSNFVSKISEKELQKRVYKVNEIYNAMLDGDPSEIIYQYVPKNLTDRYASHALPLITAALSTTGDILELGTGRYSTLALNKISKAQNKFIMSIEKDFNWLKKFLELNDTLTHLLVSSNSKCANTINMNKTWGVVFVDHINGDKRYLDLIKFAHNAEIVIAHDAEKQSTWYAYEKAYGSFKYHCKFSLIFGQGNYISTSLLSNFKSFENIEKILRKTSTNLKHVVCDQSY